MSYRGKDGDKGGRKKGNFRRPSGNNYGGRNGRGSGRKGGKGGDGGNGRGGDGSQRQPSEILTGKVQMTREGYVFVEIPEDKDNDIFVRASRTRGALNGDTVRVALSKQAGRDRRREGEIVEIVERSKTPFVGILHIVGGRQAWVLMQSKSMPYDISVDVLDEDCNPFLGHKPQDPTGALIRHPDGSFTVKNVRETVDGEGVELAAKNNVKVAVLVDSWDRGEPNPHGKLIDVLGAPGENNTEMHAILAEYGLPYRFEPEVENAADQISDKITAADLKGRRDFRGTQTFTIDPADAKDFDDALSLRKLDNGNYEIGVHIADVSYYVKPGTVVDQEAQARGTSVYLVDRTVPMLPEKLCNKLCSLRPNEDKLTFSAVFEMTPLAKVVSRWFGRTVICSGHRFAYEQAQEIIDKGPNAPENKVEGSIEQTITTMWKLASILRRRRFAAGAIAFDRPEMKVEVDAEGKPVGVHQAISKEANWLIEEFMLLANRSVAEFIATDGRFDGKAFKEQRTFIYRIHDLPNAEKLTGLREFAGNFGHKLGDTSTGSATAKSLNALLTETKETPEFGAIEMIALRSMAKACYSTDNIGHYGLAFKFYTHFTSPIRRYPDTMVHRLLAMYLDGAKSQDKEYFEAQCKHASEREVIAASAERDSTKYKLVEFMEDKVGQEFEGHISGLTDWGMYVEIEPTKIEGMVALREIRSDYYEFEEDNYRLKGRRTGNVYRLGDAVRIRVKGTNLEQRILDYELLEDEHLLGSVAADSGSNGDERGGKRHPAPGEGNPQARKAKVAKAIKASKQLKRRGGKKR